MSGLSRTWMLFENSYPRGRLCRFARGNRPSQTGEEKVHRRQRKQESDLPALPSCAHSTSFWLSPPVLTCFDCITPFASPTPLLLAYALRGNGGQTELRSVYAVLWNRALFPRAQRWGTQMKKVHHQWWRCLVSHSCRRICGPKNNIICKHTRYKYMYVYIHTYN